MVREMIHKLAVAVVALALALVISACGGSADPPEADAPDEEVTATNEVARDTDEAQSGDASLRVETSGATGFQGAQTESFPVTPGQAYSAHAWVHAPAGATMQISIREFGEDDAEIEGTISSFTGNGEWREVEVSTEFSSEGENAKMQVRTDDQAQEITFYIDGAVFREGTNGDDGEESENLLIPAGITHNFEQDIAGWETIN
jgi:hypothetical protein